MTMTLTELQLGHLYKQTDGVLLICEGETSLMPIHGGLRRYLSGDTQHYAAPGDENWIAAMLQACTTLLNSFEDANRKRQAMQAKYDNLGEALLAKAEDHGWCSEYEEFAEEWDLPKRTRDYEVTITVTVNAANAQEAQEWAERNHKDYEYEVEVEEKN